MPKSVSCDLIARDMVCEAHFHTRVSLSLAVWQNEAHNHSDRIWKSNIEINEAPKLLKLKRRKISLSFHLNTLSKTRTATLSLSRLLSLTRSLALSFRDASADKSALFSTPQPLTPAADNLFSKTSLILASKTINCCCEGQEDADCCLSFRLPHSLTRSLACKSVRVN